MACSEEDFDSVLHVPLQFQQLLTSTAVLEGPEAGLGENSVTQRAQLQLRHLALHLSEQDFQRWRYIGAEHSLTHDSDIAVFLITHYDSQKTAARSGAECSMCQATLPALCSSCNQESKALSLDPHPQAGDTGFLLLHNSQGVPVSLQPTNSVTGVSVNQQCSNAGSGTVVSVSSHQHCSNARSWSSQVHSESLQASSPHEPARDGTDKLHPSLWCVDVQGLPSQSGHTEDISRHEDTPTPGIVEHPATHLTGNGAMDSASAKIATTPVTHHAHSKRKKHRTTEPEGKERAFQCQSCEASFKKRYSLRHHIMHAHSNSAFVCQLCGMSFSRSSDVDRHTRAHHTLFQCAACSATFTNDVQYKAHVRQQHPGLKPHRCAQCDKSYTSKQSLALHCQKMHTGSPAHVDGILSSDTNGRYHCRACSAAFHRQSLLKLHVVSHRSGIPFLCNVCGLPCGDSQDLNQHMLTHTPFQCLACGAQFAHNTKYTAHIRSHHPGVKAHKCPHCDMAFNTRKWLTVHLLKHTGERPHLCPECGKSFMEAQVLQRHRLAMHQGTRSYSCSKCSKLFKTSSALAYHRRSHEGFKQCLCDKCGKTFPCPRALLTHKKSCKVCSQQDSLSLGHGENVTPTSPVSGSNVLDPGSRQCSCPDCGASFKGEQWLYRHMVNKPAACSKKFTCQHCSRVFKDNRNFVRHVRVHTGEKPFACDECKAKFTTRSDLHRHSRTHSGVKPYVCQQCEQYFRFRCDLNTHLRTHRGETPYQCAHCDAAFFSASQRLQHMRSKHKSLDNSKSLKGPLSEKLVIGEPDVECAIMITAVLELENSTV